MSFNFKQCNQQFLETHKLVLDSDAADNHPLTQYGIRIVEADAATGEIYWKVIGIHHLRPTENRGNHHIYLEALNEAGERIREPMVWADHQFGDIHEPVKLEKPATEPAGNIPMFRGGRKVYIRGLGLNTKDKSDIVENLRTDHPDEPLPSDGLGGNTRFHHSYYVVFQRTRKADDGGVTPPPDFIQYALEQALGNAITPKFGFQQHQMQAFERGIIFARDTQPNLINHLFW